MGERSTITDVAKHAGVGRATVSLVLRGKKTALRISDGTQKRVFSAAKELNYRPNILARGLSGGRTHSVGIVWDMAIPQASLSMTRDLAVRVQNHQYASYIIDGQGNINKTLDVMRDFVNRGVDGVIVELGLPRLSSEKLADLSLVLKDFSAAVLITKAPMDLQVDQVVQDRFAAIRAVADHFVRIGRTRPSIVSADYVLGSKAKAFASRLKEHGMDLPKENIVYLKNTTGISYGYRLADHI